VNFSHIPKFEILGCDTKQVKSSNKLTTPTVTKVTLVRIVIKLKLSFIRLLMIIYLIWDPKMTLALSR
jgi:hypothetical protein